MWSATGFLTIARARVLAVVVVVWSFAGCWSGEPELAPDERLRRELGLGSRDRVHTVTLFGGEQHRVEPDSTTVEATDYLQFVTGDWWVHELVFETELMSAEARRFMREHGQVTSPPMVSRGARFVVSFVAAPPGRYPYRVDGNGRSAHGVVLVRTGGRG